MSLIHAISDRVFRVDLLSTGSDSCASSTFTAYLSTHCCWSENQSSADHSLAEPQFPELFLKTRNISVMFFLSSPCHGNIVQVRESSRQAIVCNHSIPFSLKGGNAICDAKRNSCKFPQFSIGFKRCKPPIRVRNRYLMIRTAEIEGGKDIIAGKSVNQVINLWQGISVELSAQVNCLRVVDAYSFLFIFIVFNNDNLSTPRRHARLYNPFFRKASNFTPNKLYLLRWTFVTWRQWMYILEVSC